MKSRTRTPRRTLLKALGVSAGSVVTLPERWSRPLVDAVMLPAHAQTSPGALANAALAGVVDGIGGTTFTADATGSSDPEGGSLSFNFTASGACSVDTQSGGSATIQRDLGGGTCTVTVEVTNANGTATATASANVTGGPPPPPGP